MAYPVVLSSSMKLVRASLVHTYADNEPQDDNGHWSSSNDTDLEIFFDRKSVKNSGAPSDVQPLLVTVPNIELLEVGEDWATSTGHFTWATSDLQSAITSQDDPFVRAPIVKLGHTDPRFDGQPTLGRIGNLRLSENQQTLIGDLIGVPKWLAECMASAFPRRSIEGYFTYATRSGKEWPFVLTGLALLGEAYPAIDSLQDVQALFGGTPPIFIPVKENVQMLAETPNGPTIAVPSKDKKVLVAASGSREVMADTSVNDISTAFYDSTNNPEQYWWWIREIRIDPSEIIVDDDAGNLFRIPYTVNAGKDSAGGSSAITFGSPQKVRIQYIDVVAAGQTVVKKFNYPVAAGRPQVRVTVQSSKTKGHDMQLSEDVLKGLGLSAEATEEEVNAAMLAKLTAPTVVTETPAPVIEQVAATTPESPVIPEGMTLIDVETLNLLKNGAEVAASLQAKNVEQEQNLILDNAIRAGKFPPARREHYAVLLKADPEGTVALLTSLADGMIPVTERGSESQGTQVSASGEDDAYPSSWKPQVKAMQAKQSSIVKVMGD